MSLITRTVLVSAAIALAIAIAREAFSQEPSVDLGPRGYRGQGHAQNHDWYKELKQPGTTSDCCAGEHSRPTRAYRADDGHWVAMVDGEWTDVPPAAVLEKPAPDGGAHICAGKRANTSWAPTIYCFTAPLPYRGS